MLRFVNHNDGCAGVHGPSDGLLRGVCNCVSAPLTEQAYEAVDVLLGELEAAAYESEEPMEYTALRFEAMATLFTNAAHSARVRSKYARRFRKVVSK